MAREKKGEMDSRDPKMVIRDRPFVNWLLGILFLVVGVSIGRAVVQDASLVKVGLTLAFLAVGVVLLLTAGTLTITADRVTQTLTLDTRSLLRRSTRGIPFAQIASIDLESNPTVSISTNVPTYRVVATLTNGQTIPFRSAYTSGSAAKMKEIEKLRSFIGVGGPTSFTGAVTMGSWVARAELQVHREGTTRAESGKHKTHGVR